MNFTIWRQLNGSDFLMNGILYGRCILGSRFNNLQASLDLVKLTNFIKFVFT